MGRSTSPHRGIPGPRKPPRPLQVGIRIRPAGERPDPGGIRGRGMSRRGDPGPMGWTGVAGRTVLVIDDDEGVRSSIRAGLETLGLRALVAADAEAGLQLLKTTEPDLVLCDLQMPGLDGFSFMARVRETPRLDGLPIVALSGRGRLADIARSQALGFRAHLVKPLTLDVLRRLLEVVLERSDLEVLLTRWRSWHPSRSLPGPRAPAPARLRLSARTPTRPRWRSASWGPEPDQSSGSASPIRSAS